MIMKQLFEHTSTLLRTALLLGAMILVNTQTQAQEMPDAFETMDPADIIGDGNYYYIQFYMGSDICYLSDQGASNALRSKDYIPFAKNLQWTLESTGTANQFRLKSLSGNWAYLDGTTYKSTNNVANASTLTFYSHSGGGNEIGTTSVANKTMAGNDRNDLWVEVYNNDKGNARCCLRIAKLKDNVAHIIYWQETIYKDGYPVDPNTNSRGRAAGFTKHHYLTSSGTDAGLSYVSSRASIMWYYDAWALPTVAAYHQDGLWTLEKVGDNGEFYIKKYGKEEYLNYQNGISDLGTKNADYGRYAVESPNANRYTRIQNANKFESQALTASMFFNWNGVGANATHANEDQPGIDFHVGSEVGNGSTIVGRGDVLYSIYADLTGYAKLVFEGTPGMQLRVLLNRQEPIAQGEDGYDPNGGSYVERYCTLDAYGRAELDLSDLTYVHLNSIKNWSGSNGTVTAITFERTNYIESSLASSQFYTWNGVDAAATHSSENPAENIEININTYRYPNQLIAGLSNASVYYTTYADLTGCTKMVFEGTSGMRLRVLLNRPEPVTGGDPNGGTAIEKIVTINSYGKAEVDLSDLPYVHLNAIKVAGDSPNGTITSIKLLAPASGGNNNYLTCNKTDGAAVSQATTTNSDIRYSTDWYAGFYPVEVVEEDEFYNVSLKYSDQMVGVSDDGTTTALKPYNDFNPELWQLEQLDDYGHFRFKSWNNMYYDGIGNALTTNAPTGNDRGIYSNTDINNTFTVQFLPKTETRIPYDVTHKISNVRLYYAYNPTTAEKQELYSQQGLVTENLSEWLNADGTQKVNEFRITHYVKKGEVVSYSLPTVLNINNDHRLFQRWYNYDNDRDLAGLKDHFRLKVDGVEAMSYLYNNGIVTGERLDWGTIFPGARTYELNKLTYYNSDGSNFTLAGDVSRYSDFTYKNADSHLEGNLEEPSLTMRYIFVMRDAKVIAKKLMACVSNGDSDSDNWLEEEKTIHFPATRLNYETDKRDAYQGEFIGIKHLFRDYWVFNTSTEADWTDDNLVSAVTGNTTGYLTFDVVSGGTVGGVPYDTGITKGGKEAKGYYLYDEGKNNGGTSYGDSRFVGFKYPASGTATATGDNHPAYLKVYFTYGGQKYQIAKFKIIFDEGTSTLPWTAVNGSAKVKDTARDPKNLEATAGKPIAKITFDYPKGANFKTSSNYTIHNGQALIGDWYELKPSSPLPLTFDKTNYGFDGFGYDEATGYAQPPSWGSYALVAKMSTQYGNQKITLPADDETYGYNIEPDKGMQSAFLYIDASEQPGDICSVPFTGEFCAGDKLMCSGWISGSNKVINDDRCPGSVTITVKGERTEGGVKVEDNIYRFCPGQCYELDNGTGTGGYTDATNVVWQQFYFVFNIDRKYERQWIEVNNNCVSSTGGDFMLDNIEVYAMVPEVIPEMNSPICVNNTESELQLLKLEVGFEKLITSTGVNTSSEDPVGGHSFGIVFLDKQVFLEKLQYGLSYYNGLTLSLAQVEQNVEAGVYKDIIGTYKNAYQYAFDEALLGTPTIWDSNNPNDPNTQGAGILNFHWYHHFEQNSLFSFAEAVNRLKPIFRYTDPETQEKLLVMNGNFPKLEWKLYTDYYIIYYNQGITDASMRFSDFNICSDCSKERVFQLEPPYKILSMDSSDETQEVEVCEGKIPTVLTDLTAYNTEGVQVHLRDLNFDWWLGDPGDPTADPVVPPTLATLDNYHSQKNSSNERLDVALSTLRAYYPDATTLDGIRQHLAVNPNPSLTMTMVEYLQELVDAGQLVLHQKSVNISMKKASETDPYCYLVACPIHDASFDQSLNTNNDKYVAYFCDEPQGLRLKVGEKAPTLKCGFVPGENGFTSYDYSSVNDAVLSIRLAKKAQFETVQHGEKSEEPQLPATHTDLHYLWLPIRNAKVQTDGSSYITKAADYNVYLASTDDPVGDKAIYREASATGSLPIVGKIVELNAVDIAKGGTENGNNKLCIYFTENFEVREGYSYTLSMPFRENGDANTCDGTLLINLKIVPDYEVWTGAAGNTDWNNDQNWRRADGI